MSAPAPSWTPALIAQLRELWEAGLSGGAIAGVMGLSRNAVIGKAGRLGLGARPSPIVRAAPAAMPALGVAEPERPRRRMAKAGVVTVPAGRREVKPCCWPMGEPRTLGFRFCGDPAERGRPYCAVHGAAGTVPQSRVPAAGWVK